MSSKTSHILGSTKIFTSVANSHLCDHQISERVEIDSRIGDYSKPVFVPENLGLRVAVRETLQGYRVIFKDAYILLSDCEIWANYKQ